MTDMENSKLIGAPYWTISGVLNQAWEKINGSKGAMWLILITSLIAAYLLQIVILAIFHQNPKHVTYLFKYLIYPISVNAIVTPLLLGATMIAINHVRNQPITLTSGFQYLRLWVPLAIAGIIVGLIDSTGMFLVNLPNILNETLQMSYWLEIVGSILSLVIASFFMLTLPLIADKKLAPIEAIKRSFQITLTQWHKIFATYFILGLMFFVLTIPLILGVILKHNILMLIGTIIFFTGLVWLAPYFFLCMGTIYHKLVDR